MSYRVVISKSAERELKALDENIAIEIGDKLMALAGNPYPLQSKRLHPSRFFRLRVGCYRAIYDVNTHEKLITVLHVGRRAGVYRKLRRLN